MRLWAMAARQTIYSITSSARRARSAAPEKVPESAIKFYEDRLVTQFRAADEQLAHTPYLTGSEITVADLGLYPIYAGRKALIDGAGLKNVTAWGERVGARPAVRKGMRLES